jgi:hypothetical protein
MAKHIPSRTYFPGDLQGRAAWFQNFSDNFATVGASLGFTPAEISDVQDDNTAIQDLAAGRTELDAFVDAVTQYRSTVLENDIDGTTLAFPAAPSITPSELRPTGLFQRLIELVDRIRAAPAYTPEIGALLGVIPSASGGPSAPETDSMKPVLKSKAKPANVVEIAYTKGKTDGIDVEIKIDNAADWSAAGRFTASPAVLNIDAGTGLPRSVQIRARYFKSNDPIGLYSETYTAVAAP